MLFSCGFGVIVSSFVFCCDSFFLRFWICLPFCFLQHNLTCIFVTLSTSMFVFFHTMIFFFLCLKLELDKGKHGA